jgi:hypothetical protein
MSSAAASRPRLIREAHRWQFCACTITRDGPCLSRPESAFCYRLLAWSERLSSLYVAKSAGWLSPAPESDRDLFPAAETLYVPHRPVKCLVRCTFSIACATQMAPARGEVSSSLFKKSLITWSPLTESNRRPSPYHRSPNGSVVPGRADDQAERKHRQAPASPRQALTSTICPSICPSL